MEPDVSPEPAGSAPALAQPKRGPAARRKQGHNAGVAAWRT